MSNSLIIDTIKSACGFDVPIFEVPEGFACVTDFVAHEREIGTTRYGSFLRDNGLLDTTSDKQFVAVSHTNGVYMIEKGVPDEYMRIPDNRKDRLDDVRRFFTKDSSIYDKSECGVCYERINHNLSTKMFNETYLLCPRCFNVVCRLCVTSMALHTNSLACPFCKFS